VVAIQPEIQEGQKPGKESGRFLRYMDALA